jgi:hypothetical protein
MTITEICRAIKPIVLGWLSDSAFEYLTIDPPGWYARDGGMGNSVYSDGGIMGADYIEAYTNAQAPVMSIDNYISFYKQASDPASPPNNVIYLYAKGSGAAVELYVKRSDGTVTQIS